MRTYKHTKNNILIPERYAVVSGKYGKQCAKNVNYYFLFYLHGKEIWNFDYFSWKSTLYIIAQGKML